MTETETSVVSIWLLCR